MLKNHRNSLNICLFRQTQTTNQPLSNFEPRKAWIYRNFDSWGVTVVAQKKIVNQDYFLQLLDIIVKTLTERVFRWELKWKFASPWKKLCCLIVFIATEMKWNSFLFQSFDLLSLFWWNNSVLRCFLSNDIISMKWNHPKNEVSTKFYYYKITSRK